MDSVGGELALIGNIHEECCDHEAVVRHGTAGIPDMDFRHAEDCRAFRDVQRIDSGQRCLHSQIEIFLHFLDEIALRVFLIIQDKLPKEWTMMSTIIDQYNHMYWYFVFALKTNGKRCTMSYNS